MFEGLFQPTHLIIILIIVLVVFGPGKLPEIGGSLGKSITEFKRSLSNPEAEDKAKAGTGEPDKVTTRTCPACNAENTGANQFCGNCGAKLA